MNVAEREGGDITAAHMVNPTMEPSKIQEHFAGSTVFVTGGTGFLGRILVERLLSTCHDLKKVYLLIRAKKGKSCEQRFEEYFNDPLYDCLKRKHPKAMAKLFIITGDCALPDLGLNEESKQIIIDEVNCIFHCAATVRFDEKLRIATRINVRATSDILSLAKKVKNLNSIVYISTAYSFCIRKEIDEIFYNSKMTGSQLMMLVETLDDAVLGKIVPVLIGKWPNTYAFTKAVAEDVVQKEGVGLPLAVVRPSIVVGTAKDPVAGWIDNHYGATGIFVGAALGFIRTLQCDPAALADLVPADYVINCTLAAAWDIANRKSLNLNNELSEPELEHPTNGCGLDIPIYNYVSAPQNPITWNYWMTMGYRYPDLYATTLQVWTYVFWPNPNYYIFLLYHYMFHLLPAYIVDLVALCIGKQPGMVKAYKKIEKFLDVIAYFSKQQWIFRNNNTQALWSKLNSTDREIYDFNIANIEWEQYFHTVSRGCRVYLLKDPLETIQEGRCKLVKLKIAHYTLLGVLFLVALKLLHLLWNVTFAF